MMRKLLELPLLLLSLGSSGQNFEWFKQFGPGGMQEFSSLERDGQNNLFVSFNIEDSIDVDPGPGNQMVNSNGIRNIIFAKYDSDGNLLWAKRIEGDDNYDTGTLKVDSTGNLFMIGHFKGNIDLDPSINNLILSTGTTEFNLFYAQYSPNGDLIKAFMIGEGAGMRLEGYQMDDTYLYVSGMFEGSYDFNPGIGTYFLDASGLNRDKFLSKLDLNGNFIHAVRMGNGPSYEAGSGIVLTENRKLLFTGSFSGSFDCDPSGATNTITSTSGYDDFFIASFDNSLNFEWVKVLGTGTSDESIGNLNLIDEGSNFIFNGLITGQSDFESGPGIYNIGNNGENSVIAAKYDTLGNLIWAKSMKTGDGWCSGYKQVNNHFYTVYTFHGSIDVDPSIGGQQTIFSQGVADFVVAKYDDSLNYMWSSHGGSTGWDYGFDLEILSDNSIVFGGSFENTLSFDTAQFNSQGEYDCYLIKIQQDICSGFSLSIDSVSNFTCNADGYASAHVNESNGSVQYLWNSTPSSTSNQATFNSSGIFEVTVTDSIGCVRNRSILINGPSSIGYDLHANLQTQSFRTGFSSSIWLDGFNEGCTAVSGTMYCVLDPLVNFNSSIPSPDNISGDTLSWNFTNLTYDSLHITPVINVTTNGQIGDTVCFLVMIDPMAGDADTTNNYKSYCFPVVNGYDPNDKQVYPQGECIPNYVLNGEPLTYTVRFQNTGNADAINIHILDTLDADLDLNSLRVIGNSHYLITEILPGNVMKFRFDNIHLPDSGTNELLSHGYVIYEVKPLAGTPDYTLIENTSHIYFDFNPAIVTNTTGNTLVDSIPTFSSSENISVCYDSEFTLPDGTVYSNIISPISHQSNLWMVDGCDSIITTNISVLNPIDTVVTLNNLTITANASGLNYQWLDCSTGLPIGITTQSFTPTVNGEYSVIVSNGTCSDTSACILINTIGINENQISGLNIYPNPFKNILTIEQNSNSKLSIEILNIEGRLIQSFTSSEKNIKTDVSGFANGMYFINVKSETGNAINKLVKE